MPDKRKFSCRYFIPLIFLLALNIPTGVHAEALRLQSGELIVGTIVEYDDESIKIDTGVGFPVTYFLDEIVMIDGEPVSVYMERAQEQLNSAAAEAPEQVEYEEIVQELEPIALQTRKIVKPEPKHEEVIKEIAVVEQQSPAKEARSPFGPSIKDNKEEKKNSANTKKLVAEESQGNYLAERIINEMEGKSKPKYNTGGESSNAIIRIFNRIVDQQKRKLNAVVWKIKHFTPFLKEELQTVPVPIRQNLLVISLAFLFMYDILVSYPLMKVAGKLKLNHGWLVWVPVIQLFYFVYMAKRPFWWTFLLLVPFLNIVVVFILFASILESLEKESSTLLFLLIVPVVQIMILWYLAFARVEEKAVPIKGPVRF